MPVTDPNDQSGARRRARNRMVEDHAHIVNHCIRRYRHRGVADDDLRQTAFLALVEAAERFDPSRDVKFATFASRTIDGTLKRYFRDRTWLVRPPRPLQELHLKLRSANQELAQNLGRPPTLAELAGHLDVDVDDVHHAMEAAGAHDAVSIDAPRPNVEEGDLRDPSWIGQEEGGYELAEARVLVEALLHDLDPDERRMLELRFVDQLSQSEIAAEYHLSQSYLSRRVRTVLAKVNDTAQQLEPL